MSEIPSELADDAPERPAWASGPSIHPTSGAMPPQATGPFVGGTRGASRLPLLIALFVVAGIVIWYLLR
ncbi:MAG: hypothetical protein JWM25_1592 [Thermoleophilia bacterium]|nr:hypothetical protein [Thermoleophilia bacterium]MCZ4497007.1 hypothetical protein [Thermoleophilia bacterium]